MTKPTYDLLVETLADTHKALEHALARGQCKTDDTYSMLCRALGEASSVLHDAEHEDYNSRVKMANLCEKLANSPRDSETFKRLLEEADFMGIAELLSEKP